MVNMVIIIPSKHQRVNKTRSAAVKLQWAFRKFLGIFYILINEAMINNQWRPPGAAGEVRLRGELRAGGRPPGGLHRVLPVRHAGAGLGLPAPLPRVPAGAGLLRRLISFWPLDGALMWSRVL